MTTLAVPTNSAPVTGPPQGQWTYADWEALPDDGNRYEIINGVLYMTTAPSLFHQWISTRLVRYVGIPAEDQELAYWFTAPVGVIMPGCDPVQPDFLVILKANAAIMRGPRIMGVPDLIVEIISPGSAAYDERVKLAAYAAAGVPEYGIVDPGKRLVSVYALEKPGRYMAPRVYGEADQFSFACLPTVSVKVGDLFAGAPDPTP